MEEPRAPSSPSESGRSAIAASRQSHDVLSEAQQHLYRVLSEAQVGRESAWASRIRPPLAAAAEALEAHAKGVRAPGGLYEELVLDAPWLAPRLEALDRHLDAMRERARELARLVAETADAQPPRVGDVRGSAELLLADLRHLVTEENELVYERWREPPAMD